MDYDQIENNEPLLEKKKYRDSSSNDSTGTGDIELPYRPRGNSSLRAFFSHGALCLIYTAIFVYALVHIQKGCAERCAVDMGSFSEFTMML
jgi:hypothetical protein